MIISKERAPFVYEISKKVFEGALTFTEGKKKLIGENRMKPNSAADYINTFRCMAEGKGFTRTINAYSMEYFLDHIYRDYGSSGLIKALTALRLHIEYYEGIRKVVVHMMRDLFSKFSAVPIDSPDEVEQTEIVVELKKQKKTKQEVVNELNNLKQTDPEVVIINSKSFKRDNKTIAQLKFLRDFKCQICSTSIKKKDGTFYVEAAHIEPKHRKGRETPDNILLLCPNHHKEFDIGDRSILQHTKDKIKFVLNGVEYTISLKIN